MSKKTNTTPSRNTIIAGRAATIRILSIYSPTNKVLVSKMRHNLWRVGSGIVLQAFLPRRVASSKLTSEVAEGLTGLMKGSSFWRKLIR